MTDVAIKIKDVLAKKLELGMNMRKLTENGIMYNRYVQDRGHSVDLSKYIEFDDDGYCKYVDGGINNERKVPLRTKNSYAEIIDILYAKQSSVDKRKSANSFTYSVDEKINAIKGIFETQPCLKTSMFNATTVMKTVGKTKLSLLIDGINFTGSKKVGEYILGLIYGMKNANSVLDRIRNVLEGYNASTYEIYKLFSNYNKSVNYVRAEWEMATMSVIPDKDLEFDDKDYDYLWLNCDANIISHYISFMSKDKLTRLLRRIDNISDAAYRLVCDSLPNQYIVNGLNNYSNIFHRLQKKGILDTDSVYFGCISNNMTLLSVDSSIRQFLIGKNEDQRIIHKEKTFIVNMNKTNLRNIMYLFGIGGNAHRYNQYNHTPFDSSDVYTLYKIMKYATRFEITSAVMVKLINYIAFSGDYWILDLAFSNHFVVQESYVIEAICNSPADLYNTVEQYIRPEPVELHECSNAKCPFKQRIIVRTKSARAAK